VSLCTNCCTSSQGYTVEKKTCLWISEVPGGNRGRDVEDALASRNRDRHGVVVEEISLEKLEAFGSVLQPRQMRRLPVT
jgi:hypothetical protein